MADEIFTDEELKALETAEAGEEQQPEVQQEEAEQQSERPRDEQGRFTKKEDDEAAAEPKPDGKVPQGALHAERERRKGVEVELKKAQEQLAALAKMREQIQSRQPTPLETPPAQDDGTAHLTERLAQLEQSQHKIGQTLDMQQVEAAENQHIAAVVAQSEAAYRAEKPDYDDAIKHVVNARAQELALYGLSSVEIRTALGNEVADIARSAIAQGKDPAELGYQIALSRGYRPNTETGQAQRTVDAVATAKAQSRSLGQAAGATPKQLTADAITAMSPEEFEELYMTAEGRKLIDSIAAGN